MPASTAPEPEATLPDIATKPPPAPLSTRRGAYGLYPLTNRELRDLGILPTLPAEPAAPAINGRHRWPTMREFEHYLGDADVARAKAVITLATVAFMLRADFDSPDYDGTAIAWEQQDPD